MAEKKKPATKKKAPGGSLTFPKGEVVWVQYRGSDGAVKYIITSKGADMHTADRSMYYAYECAGGEWKKLGRGKNPAELEEKYVRI